MSKTAWKQVKVQFVEFDGAQDMRNFTNIKKQQRQKEQEKKTRKALRLTLRISQQCLDASTDLASSFVVVTVIQL